MKKIFLLAFILLNSAYSQQIPKHTIALLPFENKKIDKEDSEILTSILESEFSKKPQFTVLERSQMDAILQEQGFQASGACSSSECQVEIGQLLGVEYLIVGSMGKLGSTYILTAKLLDVQTGEIIRSSNQTSKGSIDNMITKSLPVVVDEISGDKKAVQRTASNDDSSLGSFIDNTITSIQKLTNNEKSKPGIIGIQYKKKHQLVVITKVFPKTPASESRISIGDYIKSINSVSVSNKSIMRIKEMLKGSAGTSVTLLMVQPAEGAPAGAEYLLELVRK